MSECDEEFQTPLEEAKTNAINTNISPLKYKYFERMPTLLYLKNNGAHIVVWYEYGLKKPTISEGPFGDGKYRFDFMYFHWLQPFVDIETESSVQPHDDVDMDYSDSHDVDDIMEFPVQLHIVFINNKYGFYDKAIAHPDGLVIWIMNFEV